MPTFPDGKLLDFFQHYEPNRPQHVEGARRLERSLREKAPELLADEAYWVQGWRSKPAPEPDGEIRLDVPYFAQGDSDIAGQGPRMCFSSSCAMLVAYLKPGALSGPGQADDIYLRRVLQYGDTTNPAAQLRALQSYGVAAQFRSNLDWDHVESQLERGKPCPIGILHHGHVSAPSGGGHWILVIGCNADRSRYLVHDPAGELDLVGGGYGSGRSGRAVWYSAANLGRRWMVEGPDTGWGIVL